MCRVFATLGLRVKYIYETLKHVPARSVRALRRAVISNGFDTEIKNYKIHSMKTIVVMNIIYI